MPNSARLKPGADSAGLWLTPQPIPLIMGVLNVTPDSFYAASRAPDPQAAVEAGLKMLADGADLIDIGGQSTRPGSEPVSAAEELRRVIPVVSALVGRVKIPISIDTDKAVVARRALEAGASIINDVSALRNDPDMKGAALLAQGVVIMHMRGIPKTMQVVPHYEDVVKEVKEFFLEREKEFRQAGGDASRLLLDPGIGFGKDLGHNLSLLKHLGSLAGLGRPLVIGVSRKSFLGRIMAGQRSGDTDRAAVGLLGPEERLEGSLAAACWAALQGARVLRVHDVSATRRALDFLAAVSGAK